MIKQTELENSNESIMIHGKKINIKDCMIELHQSSPKVDHNLFKGTWKWIHIDTFEEMFIVDDVGKKFHSKL